MAEQHKPMQAAWKAWHNSTADTAFSDDLLEEAFWQGVRACLREVQAVHQLFAADAEVSAALRYRALITDSERARH